MDHMTMRLMFPREAVLGLLDEPEFEGCMTLVAQRDVKPVPDVYLAVFVVQVEPVPECGLRLCPVSTTVIGITRTSSKRLVGEGLYWADTKPESPASSKTAAPRIWNVSSARTCWTDGPPRSSSHVPKLTCARIQARMDDSSLTDEQPAHA